jgi:hypothetical protein
VCRFQGNYLLDIEIEETSDLFYSLGLRRIATEAGNSYKTVSKAELIDNLSDTRRQGNDSRTSTLFGSSAEG